MYNAEDFLKRQTMSDKENKKFPDKLGPTSSVREKRPKDTRLDQNPAGPSLKSLAKDLTICRFYDYKEYIASLFSLGKTHMPNYSYVQFAEDLGFSRTNVMWLVMTGRRKLTQDSAEKIIAALNLRSDHGSFLKILCQYNNTAKTAERERLFGKLVEIASRESQLKENSRLLDYFREWYHPIIRELTATAQFQSDPNWISSKLCVKVSPLQVRKSLELLEQLGLIHFDPKAGRHVRTDLQVIPDRDFSALTLISYHQKMCEIARDSVALVAANQREFNALTVSLTESGGAKIVDIIRRACEEIMAVEKEEASTDQVFHVNLQMFPVTKKSSIPKTEKTEKKNAKK
jgi:uncharacterized protein (TIGR02147 family)